LFDVNDQREALTWLMSATTNDPDANSGSKIWRSFGAVVKSCSPRIEPPLAFDPLDSNYIVHSEPLPPGYTRGQLG
jgi:hypothetical protein